MSSPERLELIRNAVTFLSDPKTQASPLAQRIQFLEAKGLTALEIEDAMRQSAVNHTQQQPHPASYMPVYGPSPYAAIPPQFAPQWDWRDYFITAVLSGAVAYGSVALFRKYLLPHLQPPTATAYEEDRDALTAQFDAAEALLKEIQAETSAVRAAVQEQNEKVDKATQDVESVVREMRDGEMKARDEMREIREEVNNIREMLPKMIERTKDSQTQSLAELQQELKSLKALLLSRGPGLSSAPITPPSTLSSRPSIPAWQLAGLDPADVTTSDSATATSSSPHFPPPHPATETPTSFNGKGKEPEAPRYSGSS